MTNTSAVRRKGILLAGGHGSRLFPLTSAVNKHLLPVHDKPMIYYPLSTLMLGGVRDVLVVSTPAHLPAFEHLLGDGSRLGMHIAYASQPAPRGIADALLVAEGFLGEGGCVLALGDNLFWGYLDFLREALTMRDGATVFSYRVQDPSGYGVVELDDRGHPTSVEEKPEHPRSQLVLPGLYVLDADAVEIARATAPSPRGELEITDVLREYLRRGQRGPSPLSVGHAFSVRDTPSHPPSSRIFTNARLARPLLSAVAAHEVRPHSPRLPRLRRFRGRARALRRTIQAERERLRLARLRHLLLGVWPRPRLAVRRLPSRTQACTAACRGRRRFAARQLLRPHGHPVHIGATTSL